MGLLLKQNQRPQRSFLQKFYEGAFACALYFTGVRIVDGVGRSGRGCGSSGSIGSCVGRGSTDDRAGYLYILGTVPLHRFSAMARQTCFGRISLDLWNGSLTSIQRGG